MTERMALDKRRERTLETELEAGGGDGDRKGGLGVQWGGLQAITDKPDWEVSQ